MKPRHPAPCPASSGPAQLGRLTRSLPAWVLILAIAADLVPPAAAASPRSSSALPASARAYQGGSGRSPSGSPLLLAQADARAANAQAGDDGYRPRRRKKRRSGQANQQGSDAAGGKEAAPAQRPEEPKRASFPGDALLPLRDEAWRITAAGGGVELVIAKGTFPPNRDTLLTVRASASAAPDLVSGVYEVGFSTRPAAPVLLRLRYDASAPALRYDHRLAVVVLLPPPSEAGTEARPRPVGGRVDRLAGFVEASIAEGGTYAVAARRPSFADLRGHPAAREISLLAARGLMQGFPDETFRPGKTLTRAQLARILAAVARQEGVSAPPQSGPPPFRDVPADAWYAPDVTSVRSLGLMLGQGDRFLPGAPVARQELALVALRLAGIQPGPAPANAVADAQLAAFWAAGGLVTAVEAGLLTTDSRRRARPRDPATRAEAARALALALERRAFFEVSTVVSGKLGKVHIPASYYELRTADGRMYVLEPGAPDVDASLSRALGGTLTVTGYVNQYSPYKIRGTALRTVKLAGITLAADQGNATPSTATSRLRKRRPVVLANEPGGNPLDDEDRPSRRRKKPVPTSPPAVEKPRNPLDEEDRPVRPRRRNRARKPSAQPAKPQSQVPKPAAQPARPKGPAPKAGG